MARSAAVLERSPIATHEAIIAAYRSELSIIEPAGRYEWEPVGIGPTWQRGSDGRFLLPERSLGWDVLGWCGTWLQHGRDEPWHFTREQARFVLWWYALDEYGDFIYRDGVFQRMKGHGKDPLAACLLLVEMLGPCRFDGWDSDGQPLARDVSDAWVQTAAVSLEQTKNTMRLLPGLVTPQARRHFELQIGKEKVYALADERLFEAVTSSPATLEGARASFLVLNETHHWREANDGIEMAAVIARNAAKSPQGAARTLRITNAYEPGQDSVAERDREAYEKMQAGLTLGSGLLYDSLEASADAPLTAEAAPEVVRSIRGDSVWLSPERIVQEILDPRNPPSQSRRFWYNQITAAEDAWLSPQEWDSAASAHSVPAGAMVTLGFDGSKNEDHSALVGCEVETGHIFTVAVWNPDEERDGEIDRLKVNKAVADAFSTYDVVGFYADRAPWESYVDQWALEYGDQLCARASTHQPIAWDTGSRRQATAQAMESFKAALIDGDMTHDGSERARWYALNARMFVRPFGIVFEKESRNSSRKVDWLDAAVLARLARQDYLLLPDNKKRQVKHEVQIW